MWWCAITLMMIHYHINLFPPGSSVGTRLTITYVMIPFANVMITITTVMIPTTYVMICHHTYDDMPSHLWWCAITNVMIIITYVMIAITYVTIPITNLMISSTYVMIPSTYVKISSIYVVIVYRGDCTQIDLVSYKAFSVFVITSPKVCRHSIWFFFSTSASCWAVHN